MAHAFWAAIIDPKEKIEQMCQQVAAR